MHLSAKQYQTIKLTTVIVLAVAFGQSVVYKNFFLPVALLLVASLLLLYFRRQVKEVLADERDYATAGKSASLAIQIYSWIAVVAMFLLYSLSDRNPYYYPVALTLAFSTVILMLINAIIFRYHNKFKFSDRKLVFIAIAVAIFLAVTVLSLRVFSGEDDWMCQDGQWVEHGHPSFPAPSIECK